MHIMGPIIMPIMLMVRMTLMMVMLMMMVRMMMMMMMMIMMMIVMMMIGDRRHERGVRARAQYRNTSKRRPMQRGIEEDNKAQS